MESYDIGSDLIGGILVNDSDGRSNSGFVAVHAIEPYHDKHYGHTLIEFADATGAVRGSWLSVPAGRTSPIWRILPGAGSEQGGYYEIEAWVGGSGTIRCLRADGSYVEIRLPDDQRATDEHGYAPLRINPGDKFQIEADSEPEHPAPLTGGREAGLSILTFCPAAPFKLEYEQRVESLNSEGEN